MGKIGFDRVVRRGDLDAVEVAKTLSAELPGLIVVGGGVTVLEYDRRRPLMQHQPSRFLVIGPSSSSNNPCSETFLD